MSALAAHQDAQWIPVEGICLAKSVVEEPDVMLRHEIRRVPEHRDGRRRRLDLCRVVETHVATGGLRRLAARNQLSEALVDIGRRDAAMTLLIHLQDDVEHLRHSLAGLRRREEERYEVEIWSLFTSSLLVLRRRLVVLLGDVPLVDDD